MTSRATAVAPMADLAVGSPESDDPATPSGTATLSGTATPCGPPVQHRRRGAALEQAILEATYNELSEMGYTAFSVESVAARARTGKASIYRRWPTKQLLVMDALSERLPTPEQCGLEPLWDDSVTTEDALRQIAQSICGVLKSPAGRAMRAIKCEALADPELARAIDERFQAPRRAALVGLLRRGVERGEVRPDAASPLIADVLPALLTHRVLLQGEQISDSDVTEIIEQILIPLVAVRTG